jgi:hypothetical protein
MKLRILSTYQEIGIKFETELDFYLRFKGVSLTIYLWRHALQLYIGRNEEE